MLNVFPRESHPPAIADEDWAARLASRMRGAYQTAARLLRNIKDPKTRERFEQRQEALEKAIKRVDDAVKRGEDRDAAEKIAKGHAWETHFAKGKQLPDQVKTPQDLVKKIEETLKIQNVFTILKEIEFSTYQKIKRRLLFEMN